MKQFLSCDWGTSSFRLKLVETDPVRIVAEVQNDQGILATHSAWQQNGSQQDRSLFYASVIESAISQLEVKVKIRLSGVPVVVSGMASSSLGMVNLPYKHVPFKTDGSDLELTRIKPSAGFDHDIVVLSGVCTETDVMRGEETQLVGAVDPELMREQVFIFPGTHSKHIVVRNSQVVDFRTYMTGELFSMLSKNSTLAEAVRGISNLNDKDGIQHFREGVNESERSNLLNSLFTVRTRFLLQKYSGTLNQSYLSGLLIGSELRALAKPEIEGITLVSSSMRDQYEIALQTLQFRAPVKVIQEEDVTVRGQLAIASRHPETRDLFLAM